jgi:hypothetical protein
LANIILSAVKDTYISGKSPLGNFSGSSQLKVSRVESGKGNYASIIGFDLSSIPNNKIITNLVFKAYYNNLYNESQGLSWHLVEYYTNPPQTAVKARALNGYTLNEIDALTYNDVQSKMGLNNPYGVKDDVNDASASISYTTGGYLSYNVKSYSNSECIVAMFFDENYSLMSGVNAINFISLEAGSTYAPKLEVTYIDYVPPKPTNLIPSNSARNRAGEIKLSWNFQDENMGTTQAAYQLVYSIDNFATSTTVSGTTNNYHVIPANTFTNGATVKWKVKVTDSNGDVSEFSDIASFTIGATLPSVPEVINPVNTIVNSSDIVVFRWKFTDQYGYSQAKFDLQYQKGTDAATTVSITNVLNQYSLPINVLSGGNYKWRVRCYNAFNEVGPYSDWYTFYSIGRPNSPEITSVTNKAQPTINWHSTEQDLFVIKIYENGLIIYDSQEVPGATINSYKIDKYLHDGSYSVGVKTSNIYGFWSAETIYLFTISTIKPDKPIITGTEKELYNSILITSNTAKNLIYRKGSKDHDYIQIASITSNTLLDYSASAGQNQYFVRALSDSGFNDSDILMLELNFDGIIISDLQNQSDFIQLWKTKDNDKRKTISLSKDQHKTYCNGREYPISQSTTNKNHAEQHEYFISSNQFDDFYRISSYNTLLYRNDKGYSYVVEISNVVIREDVFGYILSFTLTRLEE